MTDIEQQRAEAGVDPLSELLQAKITAAEMKLKRLHLEARAAVLEKQLAILRDCQKVRSGLTTQAFPRFRRYMASPLGCSQVSEPRNWLEDRRCCRPRATERVSYFPDLRFFMQYNRNTTILNDVNAFFAKDCRRITSPLSIGIQIPIFDMGRRAKAKESAADALRAKVEAEQAEKQNDLAIAELSGIFENWMPRRKLRV